MNKIIVGFSHSTNIFSRLIMWATKSKISHTYIILPNSIVYQASGLKVNEVSYEYFLTYETVIKEIEIELTDEQFAKGEQFRIKSLGKPYSIREILGFSWILFMKSLGKKVTNPFKDGDKAYVCVKLVADYIDVNDLDENLTPDDLYQLLMNK